MNQTMPPFIKEVLQSKRLRPCPICNELFWQGRSTQLCCSPKHAQTYRTRKYRARKKALDKPNATGVDSAP